MSCAVLGTKKKSNLSCFGFENEAEKTEYKSELWSSSTPHLGISLYMVNTCKSKKAQNNTNISLDIQMKQEIELEHKKNNCIDGSL